MFCALSVALALAILPACGNGPEETSHYEPPAARTVALADGEAICRSWSELLEDGADPAKTLPPALIADPFDELRMDPSSLDPEGDLEYLTATVRGQQRQTILVLTPQPTRDSMNAPAVLAVARYLAAAGEADRPPRSTVRFAFLPQPTVGDEDEAADRAQLLADYLALRPFSNQDLVALVVVDPGSEESVRTNDPRLTALVRELSTDTGVAQRPAEGSNSNGGGGLPAAVDTLGLTFVTLGTDLERPLERCTDVDQASLERAARVLLTLVEKLDGALSHPRSEPALATEAPSTVEVF